MSRVFLIGTGPLPTDDPRELGFPQLRTRQMLLPLLDAGHEVMLACLTRRSLSGERPAGRPVEVEVPTPKGARRMHHAVVRPDEPGRFLMLRDLRRDFGPDVTVTAGPFLPMAGGARAAGDEPLWVDVPGDPMCEAQAKAHRSGSVDPIHRYREMLGQALARGDRFSVISPAQRGTLVGALGLAGRLTGEALGDELVHVIPGSVDGVHGPGSGVDASRSDLPAGFPSLPRDAWVVLFCGGYNNWLDGDTMLHGLLAAMSAEPRIHFVSTGGALAGHDEGTYHRFRAGAEASDHSARFHFCGWVPTASLPAVFRRADLTLSVDRPCYEAEFGARTRILESLERGVPVASTDLCALTSELAAHDLLHVVHPEDPGGLADLLVHVCRDERAEDVRTRWAARRARYGLSETTAPLLRWVRDPVRAPGGVPVDFLEDSWQELARLQDRLEEVWKSPTWRYLGRLHQLLRRVRKN